MKRTLVSLFALASAMTLQCLADSAFNSVTVKFFVDGDEYFFRKDPNTHEWKSTIEFLLYNRYCDTEYIDYGDRLKGLPSYSSHYDLNGRYWMFNGWKAKGTERIISDYDPVDPDVTELEADFVEILPDPTQYFWVSFGASYCDDGADEKGYDAGTIGRALAGIERLPENRNAAVWLSGQVQSSSVNSFETYGPFFWECPPTHGCTFDVTMVVVAESGRSARFDVGTVNIPLSQFGDGTRASFSIRYTLPKEFFRPGDYYRLTFEANRARLCRTEKPCPRASIELSTELPSTRVNVVSADPSKGELAIGWRYENTNHVSDAYLASQTYSIWRTDGLSSDLQSASCIATGVSGCEFKDAGFSNVPGTANVMYYVVPESGVHNVRYEAERPFIKRGGGGHVTCRYRAGLCLGLSSYDDDVPELKTPEGKTLEGHKHDWSEAFCVEGLLQEGGGDFESLCDYYSTWNAATNKFHWLSKGLQPGDVFFFYIATHGNKSGGYVNQTCTDKPIQAVYDRIVSTDDVKDLLKKEDFKNRGIKFIGIINTCYSGDFVKEFENDPDFDNTAWVASSSVGKLAACGDWYSHFGTFFIDWGWEGRNAKRPTVVGLEDEEKDSGSEIVTRRVELQTAAENDKQLNLYEIGKYAEIFLIGQMYGPRTFEPAVGQRLIFVNEKMLKTTDVVNDVGEVPDGALPSPPDLDIENDYRGVRVIPRLPEGEEEAFVRVEWDREEDFGEYILWPDFYFYAWAFYKPYKESYDDEPYDIYGLWNFTENQEKAYSRWDQDGKDRLYGLMDKASVGFGYPGGNYRVSLRSLLPGGWGERGESKNVIPASDNDGIRGFSAHGNLSYAAQLQYHAPDNSPQRTENRLMPVSPVENKKYQLRIVPLFYPERTIAYGSYSYLVPALTNLTAYVTDEEGNDVCAYSTEDVREETDGTNSWFVAVSPSHMNDLGELRVRMTLTDMSGTLGAYSFAGYSTVNTDIFFPHLFPLDEAFWPEDVTLGGQPEYVPPPLPELPQVREENLILTISFDAGVEGESPEPITRRYGEPYGQLPVPRRTKAGYRFEGWRNDLYNRIEEDDIAVASGTLYASWDWGGTGGDSDGDPQEIDGLLEEYGPFVPGVVYTNDFRDVLSPDCKVTGLPKGMKWDSKLCAVVGAGEKPSTNVVTFSMSQIVYGQTFKYKDSATFIVGPLPVLSVQTAGEGTGKVSGAGAYAANKKVTLKATADTKDAAATAKTPVTVKSVFAGWYDAAGDLVSQAPSLSYVMPPNDVTLQARFIPASNDWATVDCATEAGSVRVVTNETKVAIAPITVTPSGGSLPTVKVAGLPTGLKFTAKDILKKGSKTEVDIPANTIYGTPTKGGVYIATVTVTTAGKASVVRVIKFVIRTASDYVVDADWDPVQGKVTGVGIGNPGKKVTLKATANKGYVFNGWYLRREGAPETDEEPLTQAASYSFSMPSNDVSFTAKFVTAEEDKASIGAEVNGMAFGAGSGGEGAAVTKLATNVMCGVCLEWPVAASALSLPTVKVSGLPSGLKFTTKPVTTKVTSGSGKSKVTTVVTNVSPNTIYGAPSAASKTAKAKDGTVTVKPSEVKVTVTTAGKNTQVYQIDMTVDPLPDWAVGTFAGPSYGGGRGTPALPGDAVDANGVATVSVAASGKITAKQPVNGKSTSFAASYFDSYDAKESSFWATLTAKVGKEIVTNEMAVCGHAGRVTLPDGSDAVVTNGVIAADRFNAWQYGWKAEPWKAIGKSFDKQTLTYYLAADGTIVDENDEAGMAALGGGQGLAALPVDGTNVIGRVSLKFAASGTVSVAGEFATYDKDGNIAMKSGKPVTVKASGSATLLPAVGEDGEIGYLVFVYLAPKGLVPHARCLEIGL